MTQQAAFNDRIARITNKRSFSSADMTSGEGVATLRFSSPLQEAQTVRKYHKVILMGLVLGMIAGVLVSGSVNPNAIWGPGSDYHAYVALPAAGALIASPVLAVLGCMMRKSFPGFFFLAASYFPAVVAASLF